MPVRLAYSPDTDDAFMFWPLLARRISSRGIDFEHRRADTEALNRCAESEPGMDVCAVSIHQYAYLADRYLMLPHGGSVGAGYGPVLVARRRVAASELRGARIGVPGLRTTAYLALRLLVGEFEPVVVPVSPLSAAFEAVRDRSVTAAVLIHEGRLLYEREGFESVLELGEVWREQTGLPLPLGGNVIRRSLGATAIAEVSDVLRESIAWALSHRDEVIDALLEAEIRSEIPRDRALFDRYLSMYANQDTLDYGHTGRRAIVELLDRGTAAGVIPHAVDVEFAP